MKNNPIVIKKLEVDKRISTLVDLFYIEINFNESLALKHDKTLVFPTNTIEINLFFQTELFEYTREGKLKLPYALITGQKTKAKIYSTNKVEKKIVIRFKKNSAALFVKEPIDQLTNLNTSLFDIFSINEVNNLYEKIISIKKIKDSVENINEFLIKRLDSDKTDYLIIDSIGKMERANRKIHINDIASYYSMSIRQFQRRFKKFIGITPKQFLNNINVQNLIRNYTSGNTLNDSIHNAGYYDNSHALKLFKSVTGLNLSKLKELNKQEPLSAVNNKSYIPDSCSGMFYLS